jgi:hypothetical protein
MDDGGQISNCSITVNTGCIDVVPRRLSVEESGQRIDRCTDCGLIHHLNDPSILDQVTRMVTEQLRYHIGLARLPYTVPMKMTDARNVYAVTLIQKLQSRRMEIISTVEPVRDVYNIANIQRQ